MTPRKLFTILVVLGLLAGGSWWLVGTDRYQQWSADRQKRGLPPAEQIAESIAAPAVNAVKDRYGEDAVPLPTAKNLAVPFTSQAPHANWDTDHKEFCEEASVLMVGRYFQRRSIANADDAEAALQQIKQWELDNLGYYYDTTAAETAKILEGLYDLQVELKVNPAIEDIQRAVANGRLVIVPAAGQELGNPNYTPPGPIYHMLVIRGYTAEGKFITNDPGTRKGEEFVFDQAVVMAAMRDWVPAGDRSVPRNGSVSQGQKIVLIISGT